MPFKPMDPSLIRKMIEGHQDVITPAATMEAEILKHARCPVCGSIGAGKVTLPPKVVQTEEGVTILGAPFADGTPIVVGHAKCRTCETEFDPRSGLIIKQDEPILSDPNFTLE